MKKLFLMMGLACLFLVACNNTPTQEQPKDEPKQEASNEEHQCPFCKLKAQYANWENMEETAKAELNKNALDLFKEMDSKMEEMKAEGKAECEKKCGEVQAECEKMKAECEQLKAQWDAFETLTLDEQKDLVLGRIAAMGMGQCNHEGEGHQCQHEGEGHQCNHEGEGHQCQHENK